MNAENFLARVTKFFRADVGEVIGAYFDGEKIFVGRLTENFETIALDADSSDIERLAEKISLACRQRGWKISAVGFCLQDGDAVTYQSPVDNIPAKEIPAFVKSWAVMQSGTNAAFAFDSLGEEIWMETFPRTSTDEICAAFEKFGLNLLALSVMPADLLTKIDPLNRTKFIAEVVRQRKSPNLLSARGSAWNLKKFSQAVAAIFLAAMLVGSIKLLVEYHTASAELDAAKISIDERRDDLALKETLDADVAELHRLNELIATQNVTPKKFNLLLNLGRAAGGGVHLTKIRAEENFLHLEGISATPDAVKSYLSRVKSLVVQNARLESSTANDDGDIAFTIRATLDQ